MAGDNLQKVRQIVLDFPDTIQCSLKVSSFSAKMEYKAAAFVKARQPVDKLYF